MDHSAETVVARDRAAPGRARAFVIDTLERFGIAHPLNDAVLLVSELVTNAVRHARSDATVAIHLTDTCVRVSVTDFGPGVVEVREPSGRPGGIGLRLVQALATDWGTHRVAGGKTVWFELHR